MELFLENIAKDAMDPTTYQYFKGLQDRRIVFNDEVDDRIVESVMLPLLEMDNDGSGKPITIVLNTCGGSLFDGMPLCDIIDNLKTPTTILVTGHAYSMGGYFLMAGYSNPNVTKKCFKHSTALLHGSSSYMEGTSSSVKDTFKFTERFEQRLRDYTLSHSKITEDEYERMERYEWYMDSDDMLKYGLVDEVIGA